MNLRYEFVARACFENSVGRFGPNATSNGGTPVLNIIQCTFGEAGIESSRNKGSLRDDRNE